MSVDHTQQQVYSFLHATFGVKILSCVVNQAKPAGTGGLCLLARHPALNRRLLVHKNRASSISATVALLLRLSLRL